MCIIICKYPGKFLGAGNLSLMTIVKFFIINSNLFENFLCPCSDQRSITLPSWKCSHPPGTRERHFNTAQSLRIFAVNSRLETQQLTS